MKFIMFSIFFCIANFFLYPPNLFSGNFAKKWISIFDYCGFCKFINLNKSQNGKGFVIENLFFITAIIV